MLSLLLSQLDGGPASTTLTVEGVAAPAGSVDCSPTSAVHPAAPIMLSVDATPGTPPPRPASPVLVLEHDNGPYEDREISWQSTTCSPTMSSPGSPSGRSCSPLVSTSPLPQRAAVTPLTVKPLMQLAAMTSNPFARLRSQPANTDVSPESPQCGNAEHRPFGLKRVTSVCALLSVAVPGMRGFELWLGRCCVGSSLCQSGAPSPM